MKNILLINGKKCFHHSQGKLNQTLAEVAENFLKTAGFKLKTTVVDNGYEVNQEIEKYLWADIIIYQMPAWWMGEPWIIKKYIDEVFTCGHGKLYASDGRTRSDLAKKYGSGGLIKDKQYMISATWNAPISAFVNKDEFFEGYGIEGVYLHFHKANQFLGMSALPTFICNDVIKSPDIENDISRFKEHLQKYIIDKA